MCLAQALSDQQSPGRIQVREGANGTLVEALQRTLNVRLDPSPQLAIDGDFGSLTRTAVQRFQREHQLDDTGVVDADTWKALGTLLEEDDPVLPPEIVNAQVLPTKPQAKLSDPPVVTCAAWCIADETGAILFGENAHKSLEPASTTKIMTAYIVAHFAQEHPEILDEKIRFSARADNTVGSTSALRAGEQVTVRELLYGLLLPSGNDASVALAEHFGSRMQGESSADSVRSYDRFIDAMNDAAKRLGLEQAAYRNPHGISHQEHVISAADLVQLTVAAMKNELIRKVVATRQFGCVAVSDDGHQRNIVWKNTNQLLEIDGYSGVKTGTTSAAGACLVACGQRDGDRLIAVVLGSNSSPARYADTRNLLRWAWQQRTKNGRE